MNPQQALVAKLWERKDEWPSKFGKPQTLESFLEKFSVHLSILRL
jgi:hypothetical protein